MNKLTNPFTPGAGFLPPELAGRSEIIEQGAILAARARLLRAERGILLIGSRGVGKTALLKYLAEAARKDGNLPVVVEIQNNSQGLEELALKIREVLNSLDFASKVKTHVQEAFSVFANFVRRFSISIGSLGVEFETTSGLGNSGNLECDLSEVLLATARAAKEANTAIGLYVDELQNLPLDSMSGIVVALHHAAQELLPLYLVGSGLPTLRALVAKSKTYAERMFNYEEIGALNSKDAADAIRKPLWAMEVDIDRDALDAIFDVTGGYPFFLQECGYQVWLAAESSPISGESVAKALPGVRARLDRNFFDVRLDRISDGERLFLRTMADCSADDDTCEFADVAERLGKTTNALSMQRRALIRKGIIYAPRIGKLAYTVPRFGDYLRRTLSLAKN